MTTPAPYQQPPVTKSAAGDDRRVGVEVELAGIAVADLADLIARTLGGEVRAESIARATVADTRFGDFRVELDARSLQDRTFLEPLEKLGVEDERLLASVENALVAVATEVVPVEVVTPPIPWNRLGELDPLWAAIREAGGLGTGASFRYAFGLHLNPEVPAPMDASTILRHLQAYFLLEDWIVHDERVDWTRRVVPFIDPFPEEYRRFVLRPDYAPPLDGFITDYLQWSPTRNRVLDLLPLLTYLRPDCLQGRQVEGAHLVNARPTFHYRLPNCEIDQPGWSPAGAWNRWVTVEGLADDAERLGRMAAAYREQWDLPWRLQRHAWLRELEETWL